MTRRIIEESFPIREIGLESAHEKRLRDGHPSTLHVWWARRPLVASRASILAALLDISKEPKRNNTSLELLTEISKWENSNNIDMLNKVKTTILNKFEGHAPKLLDPFGGGGSIPL